LALGQFLLWLAMDRRWHARIARPVVIGVSHKRRDADKVGSVM
jgi:hypothetical protein